MTMLPTISDSTIEASELGWKPGYWPLHFIHGSYVWTKVNSIWAFDELAGAEYVTFTHGKPIKLTVWND